MSALQYQGLTNYRQKVFEMYARAREPAGSPELRWDRFRADRDKLFQTHPQTPLTPEQAAQFTSLRYYPYDPSYRFEVPIEPVKNKKMITIHLDDDGPISLLPFGKVSFQIDLQQLSLTLFWIKTYGGGIFLPFKDQTNFDETYAGGRYLIDTIKGADLGWQDDKLVIDFNFAYNPSCAYNTRWQCPLSPSENELSLPIHAGELRFQFSGE
ncbi:MAG: DUF1684 domain-containing protein [Chloroflexota bacterium]|nr:MAG: DUF1684 domain-containing protein [Chloroflexota bacterium]